jgi:peptide/nickel transport system ATP-binding protein
MKSNQQDGMRAKGDILLEIRNLRIEGQSDDVWHEIVHAIDLTLKRGEVLGLIGESGAGKSTIGLAAMGFARAGCRITSGSILFDGLDLATAPEKTKRNLRGTRIAYVAQSAAASFNPSQRLIDQTVEAAARAGKQARLAAEKEAVVLYGKIQLPEPDKIGERYPHQVSGGQLQRAMTAMAMACRPDLIIFDEPTTALDVTTQVEVLAAIRNLVQQYHTAAIYITHDLAVVAQMADRIMVLRHGRLVEEGKTQDMLAAPKADYTRSLWTVRNLFKPEAKAQDTILAVEGIDACYGKGLKVVDDVSFRVPRGRTVAIVGESGSGKSTLARIITGLLPPTAGTIRFDGKVLPPALNQRPRDLLRRIQMIHQSADTALNPRHTVWEAIGRPLELYSGLKGAARDRRIGEILEMIELDSRYMDRLPLELSGGQRQRIAIARALAAAPDLIICDEITSALDQIIQEEILKLLLRLQAELGISYLFITHDIATVRAISDEVIVMHRGRIVEQGPKSEVLSPPHEPYTDLLLSSVPQMDTAWLTNLLASRHLN